MLSIDQALLREKEEQEATLTVIKKGPQRRVEGQQAELIVKETAIENTF